MLCLCRVLTAACSIRQLLPLPKHRHHPWVVKQVKVEQPSCPGCWCCIAQLGCTESTPVLEGGCRSFDPVDPVGHGLRDHPSLSKSIHLCPGAPRFSQFHSLERTFLGKCSNSHRSCCPSLWHDLQLCCIQYLYTAKNHACRTGTLTFNFLPERSLGR